MGNKIINIAEPILNKDVLRSVNDVLFSKQWTQSSQVEVLEKRIAKYTKSKYCVAVSSGTAALHAVLESISLQEGDEIITTPFTFVATVNAIILSGAKPVFVDIDKYFNIDSEKIESKITKKTKAIVTVDLYGQMADYSKLQKIAKKNKLHLISDSAQSLGALQNSKSVSHFADAAIFSLYGSKNISSGEGGLIISNNSKIYNFSKIFRNQGQSQNNKYDYEQFGLNYRMTDIGAAIANGQFNLISKILKKRKDIFDFYSKSLEDIKEINLPKIMESNTSAYHQYTIRINSKSKINRDQMAALFNKKNIMTGVYYPKPLHLINHLKYLNYKKGNFPNAESSSREVLSLPNHYYLSISDLSKVVKVLKDIYR